MEIIVDLYISGKKKGSIFSMPVNYSKLPYYGSKVSFPKSQENIRKLLQKYNLQGIRFTEYRNLAAIEFILLQNNKEMAFRFKIELPEKPSLQKQVYRALFHYLKARFTSVDFGIARIKNWLSNNPDFFTELYNECKKY